MCGQHQRKRELERPPFADREDATEVLRVWAARKTGQQLTLRTHWNEPGAWGLLLVDVARHVARAYQREGHDGDAVLQRIRQAFDAEWSRPTSDVDDVTDEV